MKYFSVIIVNYNGKRFLPRLLDSLNNQSFRDFEIIFVDNASKDDSVDFVKNNYPDVKIINSQNRGYGHACNLAAKKTQGRYLIFLNEDMYLDADFLNKMASYRQYLERTEKNIGAVSCKLIDFDSDPGLTPKTLGANIDLFGFPIKNRNEHDIFAVSGCPFSISRDLFFESKGFNENIFLYGEDLDFSWRLKILGRNNFIDHNAHIFHYGGGTTGSFGPEKIANNLCCSFIPIFTNFSGTTIFFLLPIYFLYIMLISLVLFFVKKCDYTYNYEIYKKYKYFWLNIKNIYRFRKFVQKKRIQNDFFIVKYLSFLPAFLVNMSYEKLSKKYKIVN